MKSSECAYYSNDFDYSEWEQECSSALTSTLCPVNPHAPVQEVLVASWDSFFRTHKDRPFFQSRNYLTTEFQTWLASARIIFEVGCGHGSSAFPLLSKLPNVDLYVATDYSCEALSKFRESALFDDKRTATFQWDIVERLDLAQLCIVQSRVSPSVASNWSGADALLCIFALSALSPENHLKALINMADVLRAGGVILFRDYGLYDMTMFRHSRRLEERLFVREDDTLAFYFDESYIRAIAAEAGLSVVEFQMATVMNTNRKNGKVMRRVFVHAVLQKPEG